MRPISVRMAGLYAGALNVWDSLGTAADTKLLQRLMRGLRRRDKDWLAHVVHDSPSPAGYGLRKVHHAAI